MTATLTRLGFTVDAKTFTDAVTWAAKRVPAKPTVPTLGGILLEVADGELTVSGFDYDVAASGTIPVDGATDGRILVSGRLLAALLGTFPPKPVQAVVDGNTLHLTCGRVTVGLPLMSVEDYPTLPALPERIGEVDAAIFADAVVRVGSSSDLTGNCGVAELVGIHLVFGDGELRIEATNRYRAAISEIRWSAERPDEIRALPMGGVLREAVAELTGTVTVGLDDGWLALSAPGRSIAMRMLDPGKFPPGLGRVFPPRAERLARVPVAELKRAADRVRLLATGDEQPPVVLELSPGEIRVRGQRDENSAAEPIDCVYDGEPLTVKIASRYLLDMLAAAGDAEVDLSVTGANKPVLMLPASGGTYRQLVVPLRDLK